MPQTQRFLERATPESRELIGFPPIDSDYWTDATLDAVAARYPGMDMAPYRAGVQNQPL
jgi:hypothetical protein